MVGREVEAGAAWPRLAVDVLEARGRGVDAGGEPAAERLLPVEVRARQPVVGQAQLGQRVVGQLVVVGHQAGVPVAAAAVDAQVAVDAIAGDRIEVVVEVLDVARVADPVDVGACLPGPVDVLPAEEAEAPAVVLAAVLPRIAFLDELGQLLVAVPAGPVVRGPLAATPLAAAGWSQEATPGVTPPPPLGL